MKAASLHGVLAHAPHLRRGRATTPRPSPRLRAAVALAAGVWTVAAVNAFTSDAGRLGHVLNPVYLLSLALAVAAATHLYVDDRPIGPLRLMTLVAATLAFQLLFVFVWNLGVFAWLLGRAAWLD